MVLDRLRSAYNVGNIFRIAEAVRAREVICCGYTPCPPHPKLAKTAMDTDKMVPYRWCRSSVEAIRQLRMEGVRQVLAAEWNEKLIFTGFKGSGGYGGGLTFKAAYANENGELVFEELEK